MSGFVLWFTGLSGSGKSTLTSLVSAELRRRGVHVEALDGDEVRKQLSKGLGFSKEDRDANIRRIGLVARMIARSGGCCIAAAISPYRDIRDEVRRATDRFVEVYTECPIDVLAERDPKGLYKKALSGEITGFTGVDDPYEAPEHPEVRCLTDLESPDESAQKILARLEALGYAPASGERASSGERARLSAFHGGDPVDRRVLGAQATHVRARASALASVRLGPASMLDARALAIGAFAPLRGFMTSKDYLRVVAEGRLENGAPWPAPVTLEIGTAGGEALRSATEIALEAPDGTRFGSLEVAEVWRDGDGPECVGGEIRTFETVADAEDTPGAVREWLRACGAARVVAFPTRHVLSRGDEHVLRSALEFADALLVLSIIREADERAAEPRRDALLRVVEHLGSRARVVQLPVGAAADGGGVLLLLALAAKNFGASELVLGSGLGLAEQAYAQVTRAFTPSEIGISVVWAEAMHRLPDGVRFASAKTVPSVEQLPCAMLGADVEREVALGHEVSGDDVHPEVLELVKSFARPE